MLLHLLAYSHVLAGLWASAFSQDPVPYTIDLIRDEADFDPASHLAEAERLQHRYAKLLHNTNSSYYNTFIGQASNRIYYGNMAIGSPSKVLITIFDTGSSDVWVASSICGTELLPLCTGRTTYNSSASTDYVPIGDKYTLNYGSGSVGGFLSQDSIRMAGISVKNVTFVEATDATEGITNIPISCLFGLGWPELASVQNYPTPLQRFFDTAPSLASRIIAFHLRTDVNTGQMAFGAVNPAKFTGDIQYFPVVLKPYWGVSMGITKFADRVFTTNNEMAIVDTGTSLLYIPDEHFNQFSRCIGTDENLDYVVPCERLANLPDLVLSIGENNSPFPLRPDQYIFRDKDGICRSGVRGLASNDGSPLWILGCVFLRAYYSVFDFDYGEIGFAASVP